MTTINNNAAVAPVAAVAAPAPKAGKVREAREVTKDVSAIVLNDAVRAVKDTDSANWSFATSVAAMMIDALSRKVARGETFKDGKDGKLSPTVKTSNDGVLFALMVRSTFLGLQVFLDTKDHVAEIHAMPNGDKGSKAREAKVNAARDLVDGKYVWREPVKDEAGRYTFHPADGSPIVEAGTGGRMLPVSVTKEHLTAGKYPGAKAKAMVSSFANARKMGTFLTEWFWNHRRSVITGFEGRTLTADDVAQIRAIISDTFGPTFAELESAHKLGRPAPKARVGLAERLINSKDVQKLSLEDIAKLAQFFDQLHKQKLNGVKDSEQATGDLMDSDLPDLMGEDDDDAAIAA